ncbi:NKAP domain containing 1 isoform X2 [Nematolebias whitei]|nr:NKAP domain containing 1 isoform X2 [Nematolebias whitei]XP_037534165.1 NKAP domain containing 1 isoform X2 [Nematolebias whitei]
MSKQPLGKTLLRNVIRHTDAHNKIQEEMEMWKMRDWEVQKSQHKHFPDTDSVRGRMHCDRVPDLSRNRSRSRERVLEHDDREARYWTRKLYEFEAGDPDRWGHSGFKELYPEEFESDNEKSRAAKKIGHKMKKSKSDTEARLLKRSKKSSRKKKKKKKSGNEKRKKDGSSSSDCSTDDRSDVKGRQKKKTRTKSRHKNKKTAKTRDGKEDSSSGDDSDEEKEERWTKSGKKRKQDSLKDSDLELDSKKQRRNNWKAAGVERSDNSCTD